MIRYCSLLLLLVAAGCSGQEPPREAAAPVANVASVPVDPASAAAPSPAGESGGPGPARPADEAAAASGEKAPVSTAAETPGRADQPRDGEALFAATCVTCHMADGSGVPFLQPSIKDSAWISNPNPQFLLSLILRGSAVLGEAAAAYDNDMAPQDHLADAQIAALATYVRGRFANPPVGKPVTAAEVATARARPGLPQ